MSSSACDIDGTFDLPATDCTDYHQTLTYQAASTDRSLSVMVNAWAGLPLGGHGAFGDLARDRLHARVSRCTPYCVVALEASISSQSIIEVSLSDDPSGTRNDRFYSFSGKFAAITTAHAHWAKSLFGRTRPGFEKLFAAVQAPVRRVTHGGSHEVGLRNLRGRVLQKIGKCTDFSRLASSQ